MPLRFHYTRHGAERKFQRQLSAAEIEAVVRRPDKKTRLRSGTHGGIVYAHEKQAGAATLKVIAEARREERWIVTAYELD